MQDSSTIGHAPPAPLQVPKEYVALANQLADASGEVIRKYFRTPVMVDDKADESPVTIADRQAEAAMRDIIEERVGSHGIFGEEFGSVRLDAEWVWVLDPIDGTKSFITGRAEFGTLIALLHRGRPVLGMIDQPISRERWIGVDGPSGGSTLNGQPIRVRPCPTVADAVLYSTNPHIFSPDDFVTFEKVRKRVKLALYGCDCYAYALLATGLVDLVVESGLKPYDYCALIPVIRNAGGIITDWRGRDLDLNSDGTVVAAGDPELHAAVVSILSSP